jgi:UDP-N-acetylmuramate--alanine ligase
MIKLANISTCYFIGIGGIGMSALARYMRQRDKRVLGYDLTDTALTRQLQAEGIQITYTDRAEQLQPLELDKEDTLVVITPAIPQENTILTWFKERDFQIVKRAVLLGEVTRDTLCLAVAGTHGKTTTSAILGHLLASCDQPVTAFLGGIAENYQSNFIHKGNQISVVEADEYDRSFLNLSPDIACITSIDADHLDIYGDSLKFEEGFKLFAALLPDRQNLLVKKGLGIEGRTVAVDQQADFCAKNIRVENGRYKFDFYGPDCTLKDLEFIMPGLHNLQNAVTALGMAILSGTPTHCLPKALMNFKGIARRFSYRIDRPEVVLIDDYAHHPSELDALFNALLERYPNDGKLIVFQPHLYSRTRDFAPQFAQSLARFDQVLLMEIYPARERPVEGVTAAWLLEQIPTESKALVGREELSVRVAQSDCRIKCLVGAGDIGAEVDKITKNLEHAY